MSFRQGLLAFTRGRTTWRGGGRRARHTLHTLLPGAPAPRAARGGRAPEGPRERLAAGAAAAGGPGRPGGRGFAAAGEGEKAAEEPKEEGPAEGAKGAADEGPEAAGAAAEEADVEALRLQVQEAEEALAAAKKDLEETHNSNLRILADMENLRQRTSRQIANSEKFAVQGFAKAMLDVSDNLERALGAVPAEVLEEGAEVDGEKSHEMLRSLHEGVSLTEKVLLQSFAQNKLTKFAPEELDEFDPNAHMALFEVPDPSKEAGKVAVTTKAGYMIHDRVLRPAEVGVFRAP